MNRERAPIRLHGRPSRSRTACTNVAKTIVQVILFWGFFLFIVPAGISWLESLVGLIDQRFSFRGQRVLATMVFGAAGLLGLISGMTMAMIGRGTPVPFDCPNELVVRGVYCYNRNPMVVAGLAQGVAVGLFLGSWPVIVYALLGAPVWNWLVRPWEERDLLERFGDSYERYRKAVPCWRMRFAPYRPDEEG